MAKKLPENARIKGTGIPKGIFKMIRWFFSPFYTKDKLLFYKKNREG